MKRGGKPLQNVSAKRYKPLFFMEMKIKFLLILAVFLLTFCNSVKNIKLNNDFIN